MPITPIPSDLSAYVPPSLLQADGSLKPGVDADSAISLAQGIQARADALPPAEAKLFLAMIASADFAPEGQIPADVDGALDRLTQAAGEIASMLNSSSALDLLARVMVEQAGEQRKDALNDRLTSRAMAKGELLTQATQLTEAAKAISDSSKTAMIVAVVMAAVSVAAAVVSTAFSIGGAIKGARAANEITGKGTTDLPEIDAPDAPAVNVQTTRVTQADTMSLALKASEQDQGSRTFTAIAGSAGSVGQVAGQAGQAGSGYVSGQGQADSQNAEAAGSTAAAQAQDLQAQSDVRKEQQQALDQMVQAVIQFLKDLKEAKAQQMANLTRV